MNFNWLFDEAYRHRMYTEWTLGWCNVPLQAMQLYLLLLAVLGKSHWLAVAELCAVGVLVLDVVGWFAIAKRGWLKRQNSLSNEQNLEISRAAGKRPLDKQRKHL